MTDQELNQIKARWLPEFEKGASLVADIWDLFKHLDALNLEIEQLMRVDYWHEKYLDAQKEIEKLKATK